MCIKSIIMEKKSENTIKRKNYYCQTTILLYNKKNYEILQSMRDSDYLKHTSNTIYN